MRATQQSRSITVSSSAIVAITSKASVTAIALCLCYFAQTKDSEAQIVIDTDQTATVNLPAGTSGTLTVNSGVSINPPANLGVDDHGIAGGVGDAWAITNHGSIASHFYANGIWLRGPGSIDNFGAITSDASGIDGISSLVLTNHAGGIINAGYGVFFSGNSLEVNNAGTINAVAQGIYANVYSDVEITNSSLIQGGGGIYLTLSTGVIGSITNSSGGRIVGNDPSGSGISVVYGRTEITNAAGATIQGGLHGIEGRDIETRLHVNNYGAIIGGTGLGIRSYGGGPIINQAGATVSGAGGIAFVRNFNGVDNIITNAGTITATGTTFVGTGLDAGPGAAIFIGGVNSAVGTVVNNLAGGVIDGSVYGIYGGGAILPTDAGPITITNAGSIAGDTGISLNEAVGTVVNSGAIIGTGGVAIQFDQTTAFANSLTLDTGSAITGNVLAGPGAEDALVLLGSNSEDISKFIGFDTLSMQGVDWALDGTGTVSVSTELAAGLLRVNGTLTSPSVLVDSPASLGGIGTVIGDVTSLGIIAPGNSIGTLTIAGNYTGSGGTLEIEAELGDDTSPSDLLVVTGDTAGDTAVRVINVGGAGDQTVEGIKVIEVGGASNGLFNLLGDYELRGEQVVIAGAYGYTLQQNGITDPADGDWYLRSELVDDSPDIPEGPIYQAGVPLYEAYPQVLAALNTLPTLQQRLGNRYWSTLAGTPGVVEQQGIWSRIEGSHSVVAPDVSTSLGTYDVDLLKLQAGADTLLYEAEDGSRLVGGVNLQLGTATANVRSPYGLGTVSATGYGAGASLTWYGANGLYVDGQAQFTLFDGSIYSTTEGRSDVAGNKGQGYAVSVEVGQRVDLGDGLSLTPQAQLTQSGVGFDQFLDPFDALVTLDEANRLVGRIGVSLDKETEWTAEDGTTSRSHVYGLANLYYDFSEGTQVTVSGETGANGVAFRNGSDRLQAGIGVGGSFNLDDDRISIFGEARLTTSLQNPGNSFGVAANAGLRIKF